MSLDYICPCEHEVKVPLSSVPQSHSWTYYLKKDNSGMFNTKLYEKRDDLNLKVHFPFLCGNCSSSPAPVQVSQTFRNVKAYSTYQVVILDDMCLIHNKPNTFVCIANRLTDIKLLLLNTSKTGFCTLYELYA